MLISLDEYTYIHMYFKREELKPKICAGYKVKVWGLFTQTRRENPVKEVTWRSISLSSPSTHLPKRCSIACKYFRHLLHCHQPDLCYRHSTPKAYTSVIVLVIAWGHNTTLIEDIGMFERDWQVLFWKNFIFSPLPSIPLSSDSQLWCTFFFFSNFLITSLHSVTSAKRLLYRNKPLMIAWLTKYTDIRQRIV